MSETFTIIDFELIWKKVNDLITTEEDQILERWLAQDKKHRKFYDSVVKFYSEGSQVSYKKDDIDREWKTLNRKLVYSTIFSRRVITNVAVVFLGLFVIATAYFIAPKVDHDQIISESNLPIEPGTSKAILITDKGNIHRLSDKQEETIIDGSYKIKNTGESLVYGSEKRKTIKEENIKYNTLEVPRGGEFSLVLSDGTKVWLNSETMLKYPVQFSSEKRSVELIGEAFFEVVNNQDVPFLVNSGDQVVKVVGTKFNVSSFVEDSVITTTLVEGKVDVYLKSNPENIQNLLPNNQSSFSKNTGELVKKNVDPYRFVAWKEGRFVFENERLEDILKTLSKWYDFSFHFSSDYLREIRFTGNLTRYSNYDEIFKKIEKTDEIEFYIKGKNVIVR